MARVEEVEDPVGEDDAAGRARAPGDGFGTCEDLAARIPIGHSGASARGTRWISRTSQGSSTRSSYSAKIVMVRGRPPDLHVRGLGGEAERVGEGREAEHDGVVGDGASKARLLLHGIAEAVVPEVHLAGVEAEIGDGDGDEDAEEAAELGDAAPRASPLGLRPVDDLAHDVLDGRLAPGGLRALGVLALRR